MYVVEYTRKAERDIALFMKSGNESLLRKLTTLLDELAAHPHIETGKPEQLRGNLLGFWSRRINQEHRLIYSVKEETVTVLVISAKGHYS